MPWVVITGKMREHAPAKAMAGRGEDGDRTAGRRTVRLRFNTQGDDLFNAMVALGRLRRWATTKFAAEVTIEAHGSSDLDEHTYRNQVRGAIDEIAEIVEG